MEEDIRMFFYRDTNKRNPEGREIWTFMVCGEVKTQKLFKVKGANKRIRMLQARLKAELGEEVVLWIACWNVNNSACLLATEKLRWEMQADTWKERNETNEKWWMTDRQMRGLMGVWIGWMKHHIFTIDWCGCFCYVNRLEQRNSYRELSK